MNTQTMSRETLGPAERFFDVLFTSIALLFVIGFFWAHQAGHTGFFTSEFGSTEMLALYGPMALSFAAPIVRSATGLRNPGRLMEAIANAALAFGSLWLFFVFPFDFSHLADVLPHGFQFILAWFTDGIARIALALQVVIGALTAIGKLWKFVTEIL